MKAHSILSIVIAAISLTPLIGKVAADPINIAQSPLFASIKPDPNLMVTVDDSFSMERPYMPDELIHLFANPYGYDPNDLNSLLVGVDSRDPAAGREVLFSAQTNHIYYDPRITYVPWVKYNGQSCPSIDPARTPYPKDTNKTPLTTAALRMCQYNDPADPSAANYGNDTINFNSRTAIDNYERSNGFAEYWIYIGVYPSGSPGKTIEDPLCSDFGYDITPSPCLSGSYIPVVITPDIQTYSYANLDQNLAYQKDYWENKRIPSLKPLQDVSPILNVQLTNDLANQNISVYEDRTGRTDCVGPNDPVTDPPNQKNLCTYQQEITNFANWYVYYRFRKHVVRAAMGRAIAQAFIQTNQPVRMGFGRASYTGTTDTGSTQEDWGGTVKLGVRRFTVIDPVTNQIDQQATDDNRQSFFYDNLYNYTGTVGTNLNRAMDDVGRYFKQRGDTGPWSKNPEKADTSPQLACRQNYQVLLTDAYSFSSGDDVRSYPSSVGNVDGSSGPTYTRSYDDFQVANPVAHPYEDQWTDTLADYAMYYWVNDLREDLNNLVPITATELATDNAFWQHLVNYTVGLGVNGTLTPDTIDANGNFIRSDDSIALSKGTKSWPNPLANEFKNYAEKIDDLWHVAVNSRGNYFSASDPKSLGSVLNKVFNTIVVGANGSASSAAANATSLNNGAVVYQATFRLSDWSGQLLAYLIDPDGSIHDKSGNGVIDNADALWDAGDVLSKSLKPNSNANSDTSGRRVYSYNLNVTDTVCQTNAPTNTAIVFAFANLNCAQQNLFTSSGYNGQDLANYVLGDDSKEKRKASNGDVTGIFRSRTVIVDNQKQFRPLGDIINSDPLFVGSEDFDYSTLPNTEGDTYQQFLLSKSQVVNDKTPRPRMIYIGSNDGMLHGFEAGTWNSTSFSFNKGSGSEIFAYVPGAVINQDLAGRATSDPLDHKYLVDGAPVAGDAYFSGAWHTVLLGTTGAGGYDQISKTNVYGSIFALDVTDPTVFSDTAKGVNKILWEFTVKNDEDLGVPLAQPSLARMQNGKWAAIVGNGYDSKNGKAVLYILDVSKKPGDTEFIMKKFSVCDNNSSACLGGGSNGLSTPIPVDVDGDHRVDYIYAGDLLGNLWKFDVNCPQNRNSDTKELKPNSIDDTGCTPNTDWEVANGGEPLFTACDPNGNCNIASGRQPITSKPQVGSVGPQQANALYSANQSQPSVMVYFGTGKYLEVTDNQVGNSPQTQTFYGLWDRNSGDASTDNSISGRDKLQEQTVTTRTTQNGYTLRLTSSNVPNYACPGSNASTCSPLGWYMDLPTPGERSVSYPILLNGNIVFVTLIPSDDPCIPGGTSWIMELSAITGGRPATPPFDITNMNGGKPDGKFDTYDMVNINGGSVPPSGIQSTVGIVKTPALISGSGITGKYFSGSTGGMQTISDPGESFGRMSWRQLR